jgi:hypothetical protein
MGALFRLIVSSAIYSVLVALFDVPTDFMLLGVCILFAGFIAAKE